MILDGVALRTPRNDDRSAYIDMRGRQNALEPFFERIITTNT